MFKNSIAIGPEFFAKSKNDYSNWRWAVAREFLQNSIDCGSNIILVNINYINGETVLTVENNGKPMTADIITNKLLCLGSSGKDFNESVGGFGKAKEVLYFCHKSYEIRTGDLLVTGAGAGYDLVKSNNNMDGTISLVRMASDETAQLAAMFARFVKLSGWRGEFRLNGELIQERLNKGAARKNLSWCEIHSNKSHENLMVVRLGTQCMFTRSIAFKGCVVVTMEGASAKYLASNRDGLTFQYQAELDEFVTRLAVDKRSVFRAPKEPKRSKYDGYKLAGKVKATTDLAKDLAVNERVMAAFVAKEETELATLVQATNENIKKIAQNVNRMEFHIKSETTMEIPSYYIPENFSDYCKTLASRWASILVEFALLLNNATPFSIGFIFSEEVEGECETKDGEHVIFVNPVKITERPGKPRSMSRAFTFNSDGNWALVALAAHEFVHLEGYNIHDEDYSSRLTEVMGIALANRALFSMCFCGKGKVKWN